MNVVTITRQCGAGGGQLAAALAEALGWQLLDRELLHHAAEITQVPDAELDRLDERSVAAADRFRLHPPHRKYIEGLTEAVRRAAARGNVVLVGRGTSHLLDDFPNTFHVRLVAPSQWRAERMARVAGCSREEASARCAEVDRSRHQFTRHFFGEAALAPERYHLVVNTGRVPLDDVVAMVTSVVRGAESEETPRATGRRLLTLSRQLGAGDRGFAPPLARRLGLTVYDREILEREALRLRMSAVELEEIDEQPAGFFERFRPGSIYHRYFEALREIVRELDERGDVLLVGRGGSWFLRGDPRAFHVRIVAPMPVRLRRVMEYHWVREEVARRMISQSDSRRRSFCQSYFGIDWSDPLEYHITVNSGRLGPAAQDLVALASRRHWEKVNEGEKS